MSTLYERLVARTVESGGCWLWTSRIGANHYPRFAMRVNGKPRSIDAHRLMLEIILGRPLAPDEEAAHLCHTRPCINPDHLAAQHYLVNKRAMQERRGYRLTELPADWTPPGPAVDPLQRAADRAFDGIGGRTVKRCPF